MLMMMSKYRFLNILSAEDKYLPYPQPLRQCPWPAYYDHHLVAPHCKMSCLSCHFGRVCSCCQNVNVCFHLNFQFQSFNLEWYPITEPRRWDCGGIGIGLRKKCYRKKSWNRNRTNLVVLESVSEKIATGKSLGTGIGKNWYWEKVSEPISEKFGTGKSLGTETFIFVAKI